MKMNLVNYAFVGGLVCLYSCSTAQKAKLDSADPETALKEVRMLQKEIEDNQVDLLAHKHYGEGLDDYNDAVELAQDEDDNTTEVLTELSEAKAHYQEAMTKANTVSKEPTRIMEARKSVLDAGLSENSQHMDMLVDIDNDLRRATGTFTKRLLPEQFSTFQKRYLNLEVKVVQFRELGRLDTIVDEAVSNDAQELAPETLHTAQTDKMDAHNRIEQNPRDSKMFDKSILKYNKSTKLLDDVMNKLLGEAKGSSETVALKLVYQERKLGKLGETVGSLSGKLAKKEQDIDQLSNKLTEQSSSLLSAKVQVAFQEAMDKVRENFDEEEAEVYQQGDKLIMRLRNLNFPSGSSKIPNSSMPLLGKISSIIGKINPKSISVQGHTDSMGKEAFNQNLSVKRAKAVEGYLVTALGTVKELDFESYGFGESKPIANNETSKGRALNRRVDLVINAK